MAELPRRPPARRPGASAGRASQTASDTSTPPRVPTGVPPGGAQPEPAPAGPDWTRQFLAALDERLGDDDAARATAWAAALPAGYAEAATPGVAAADFTALTELGPSETALVMRLHNDNPAGAAATWRFAVYHRGPQVPLSSFLPKLESFGFTVSEQRPFRLPDPLMPREAVRVHDFGVAHPALNGPDRPSSRVVNDLLPAAVEAAWRGQTEADRLSQLVVTTGLSWSEVAVLRAYRRYRRQVGTAFTADYIDQALVGHPHIARALLDRFTARLAPQPAEASQAVDALAALIDDVQDLDADRILRDMVALVDATVRTNFWVARSPRGPLALKFVSTDVPGVPDPVPYREIFVSGPTVEGVHLRGGPVARGGIRWSSRPEDYRTEVLSLFKAQVVKNAVIVPTGAKGGFVVRSHGGRTSPEQVRAAYEQFIGALLDVTDTVHADGSPQTPVGIRALDGPDPYLVVAADRGTATFSDAANTIAEARGFWLGDAFASGGRSGYDHKQLGVTARGAWEAARHHFARLGTDPDRDPITVVGIGDMSGDVFGNGMLRSRTVRLVAAFDHRHVFLDPDPDSLASYAERERLFALPTSSWADYDTRRISDGGGVWSRSDKRIPLSRPVRQSLGLPDDAVELSGPDLVSAVLRAPADLLYAGGVGTYVKARSQSHADVGDRGNDAVRVDAAQLRARVVVEGANLALTQAARVEFADGGGAVNTDAVDNAAGVDTSDHEVNLKILLALPVADGVLSRAQRDQILADQQEWVVQDVLHHVRAQSAALTRETAASAGRVSAYGDLLCALEEPSAGPRADRARDALPTARDLQRLAHQRQGLARPQLAVLMGLVKSNLRREIGVAELHEHEPFHQVLCGYFPEAVHRDYGRWLHDRRVNRQLAAALVAFRLANDVVDRMGCTWVHEVAADLHVDRVRVVEAYWTARTVLGVQSVWDRLDEPPAGATPEVLASVREGVRRSVAETARRYASRPRLDPAQAIGTDAAVIESLAADLDAHDPLGDTYRALIGWLTAGGLPAQDAAQAAALEMLSAAADIAAAARTTGQPARLAAAVFAELDVVLRLPELEDALRRHRDSPDPWERREVQGLRHDWRELRARCAVTVLSRPVASADHSVRDWLSARHFDGPALRSALTYVDLTELPAAGLSVHLRGLRRCLDDPRIEGESDHDGEESLP